CVVTDSSLHDALPIFGVTRLDPRTLGGQGRATPPPLLQAHRGREESPGDTADHLAGLRRGDQPHHWGGTCLIGNARSPTASERRSEEHTSEHHSRVDL